MSGTIIGRRAVTRLPSDCLLLPISWKVPARFNLVDLPYVCTFLNLNNTMEGASDALRYRLCLQLLLTFFCLRLLPGAVLRIISTLNRILPHEYLEVGIACQNPHSIPGARDKKYGSVMSRSRYTVRIAKAIF